MLDVNIVRHLVIHKSDLLNFKTSYENLRIERILYFRFCRGNILHCRGNNIVSGLGV